MSPIRGTRSEAPPISKAEHVFFPSLGGFDGRAWFDLAEGWGGTARGLLIDISWT